MNKIIMFFGVIAILLMPINNYAATNSCGSANTTRIYFVNGVWNTLAQARDSQNLLKDAYKQNLEAGYPEQIFEFTLAYNYSAGKVQDIIEVIGQKLNEIDDAEANELTPSQYYLLYMTAKSFDDVVPVSARPLTTTIEEYLAGRLTDAVDSSAHIQKYRSDLQEGKRVILIAHSQGNLFANQAVSSLMSSYGNSLGMIGVASPAAVTYNDSTYYTAYDDRVIDALRLIHDVLPSNIENDPGLFNDQRDFSNHQFKDSYFATGLPSRDEIDNDLYNYIDNLEFPFTELGSGAITITLTWGSEPDVDLHVTEPNGAHVYYLNMVGTSGYLDLDDITSYGPEHYYVACDSLEVGIYSIGVNYFSGSGSELAQIQISTSDGNTRTFTQPLYTAMGTSGNGSPIEIATINVNLGEDGNYSYQITQ